MASYTIKPIKVGSILYYRGAFSSNQDQYKEKEDFPVLIFLIEGNGKKILVDTGCGDPDTDSMKISFHGPSTRLPEDEPSRALEALGVKCEEIDAVIMTHLHWDHCYNNHLFPQADFYIQRSEILGAVDPLPKFKTTYEAFTTGVIPPWARQNTRWKLIDGDYELTEGIKLIHIPGHSLGLQGVVVDTVKGPHLLASDAVPLYENCPGGDFIISGLCMDMTKYYESIEKMKSYHATVIPSHDYKVLENKVYPVL